MFSSDGTWFAKYKRVRTRSVHVYRHELSMSGTPIAGFTRKIPTVARVFLVWRKILRFQIRTYPVQRRQSRLQRAEISLFFLIAR
jgi:hypothetical protein